MTYLILDSVKIARKEYRTCIYIVIVILLLTIGTVTGWLIRKHQETPAITFVRENPNDYKFIDPVLLLQVPEDITTPQFISLQKSISSYIATAKSQHKATDVSVYFRQLNDDRWVGINQTDLYAPASMLKVVSLIAFLREAQQNPALYSATVTIPQHSINDDSDQDFYPPGNPVQIGQTYSVNDLLSHMIIYSDNNAANAVDSLTGTTALDKTFTDLKLPVLSAATPTDFISPVMYSHIFRSLYNGAYLSDAISEQALELMSKTTFTQGLVAGVPAGTVVSHKFGERTITPADNLTDTIVTRELHDCGIIYAPGDPYLLCIMTKGTDFDTLQNIISDISAITWKSVQQLDVSK
jgi:beta-lactamase class A